VSDPTTETKGGRHRVSFRHPLLWWRAAVLAAIAFGWALRIPRISSRVFDPDELQHMHSAYAIHIGMVPHRDYFDHHLPWLHFALSLLFPLTGPSITTLLVGRALMLLVTAAILYLTYRLGRQLYGREVGLLGTLLLTYTLIFVEKTTEIRPDVPATVCWLAGLGAFVTAARRGSAPWFLLSGLALGSAVMFTQKMLFGIVGVLLAVGFVTFDRRAGVSLPQRRRAGLMFVAGLSAPLLATMLVFLGHGALAPFLDHNFVRNAQWVRLTKAHAHLRHVVRQNVVLAALGMAGWLIALAVLRRWEQARRGDIVVVLAAATLIAGVWVIPVPYGQYYLPLLPLWAALAARTLWRWAEKSPWRLVALTLGLAGMLATPLREMAGEPRLRNDEQRREIQYVLDHTSAADTVLPGWRLTTLFRPHAYFYFFLHEEMRAMLTEQQRGPDVVQALEATRPKIIENDPAVHALEPEVLAYIKRNYEPTGVGVLYRRKT
jgi:4-amino-4-deoxy-L-arabinose transferase-like glycosyltransferase